MEHRECERCLVAERCLYPYLFETPVPPGLSLLQGQQQAPRPFVLVPPLAELLEAENQRNPACCSGQAEEKNETVGDDCGRAHMTTADPSKERRYVAQGGELSFGLLLIGRAVEHLPYIVHAMSNLARHGLGASRTCFELSRVAALDEHGAEKVVYTPQSPRLAPHDFATRSLDELIHTRLEQLTEQEVLRLRFITPTRIRVSGDLQTEMNFELLVRNLLRRVSLLMAVHGRSSLVADYRALIERSTEVRTSSVCLRWWDWERHSNRQHTKMKMGGFVGEIECKGVAIRGFLPLLIAGELLHVGANTSFGLGKYQVMS